jgi:GcrA cell cycle regulator
MVNTWTDDEVKIMTEMWNKGASATEISIELGDRHTRNSVIGKAHREGLSKYTRPVGVVAPARGRRGNGTPKGFAAYGGQVALVSNPKTEVCLGQGGIVCEPVTIYELTEDKCRWPVDGDGPMRYCGLTRTRKSYCSVHYAISTETYAQRKARIDATREAGVRGAARPFKY